MISPALWWLGLGLLLLSLELLTTTLFCFFLSLAAFATALLCWAYPLEASLQFLVFAVAVVLSLLAWNRLRPRRLEQVPDALQLNQRTARYVGRELILQEPIAQGRGRVNIDDSWWQARGEDMPAGTRVRVDGVDGMVLLLKRLDAGN